MDKLSETSLPATEISNHVAAPGKYLKQPGAEGNAGEPIILQSQTWTFKATKESYAKLNGSSFEVGMGHHRDQHSCADAGIEVKNVQRLKVSVERVGNPSYYDISSFAGFIVDYHTRKGYTKRVALSVGVYSNKRNVTTPIWGKATRPDQFESLGEKTQYNLDLRKWAPAGWDGQVWFVVSLQNTGSNTTLKARVEWLGQTTAANK